RLRGSPRAGPPRARPGGAGRRLALRGCRGHACHRRGGDRVRLTVVRGRMPRGAVAWGASASAAAALVLCLACPARALADPPRAPADTARAVAPAESSAVSPARPAPSTATTASPPSPRPIRTSTSARRGGPYNVVADQLEGGRTPAEGDIIVLRGNVTLSREGTVVRSQMGRYVRREGTIYLTGGVRALDGTTTITALSAAYNEKSDLL